MVYFGWPSGRVVMAFGHPFIQTILVFLAAWAVSGDRPRWVVTWIALWLLLGGMLADIWGANYWNGWLIAGMFHVTDPAGYVLEAQRIVFGEQMINTGAWRPIAHAFLSTHLYLFDGNLRLIQIVYIAWQSLAFMIALRVIGRRVHFLAGAAMLGVTLAFLDEFLGAFMTEIPGAMLGALSLACLVEAAAQRTNLRMHLLGLAILSLAMLTRAGAFFVLPAVLAWSCWVSRDTWRERILVGLLGMAVFAGAFFLNRGLGEVVADGSAGMGNFSYTLYGTAVGKNWQVGEATGLPPNELVKESLRIIMDRPVVLLEALIRAMRDYYGGALDYGKGEPNGYMLDSLLLGRLLQFSALVVVVAGLLFGRRQPLLLLFPFFLLGFLASLPFAPPWDAGSRIYAATVPLTGFMAGTGLSLPLILLRKTRQQDSPTHGAFRFPAFHFSGYLFFAFVFPIGLMTILPNPERLPQRAEDGSRQILLRRGNYAILHGHLDSHPYPPHWSKESWMRDTFQFDYFWSQAADVLEMIPPGAVLTQDNGALCVLPLSALDQVGQVVRYNGYVTQVETLFLFVEASFSELIMQIEEYLSSIPSNSPIPYLRNFDFTYFPWVSHPQLGFMWIDEKESYGDGVFLFSRDPDYGHLFTSPTLYPKFIRHDDKHELEFVPSSGKMFNRTTGEEMELPQDPPKEGGQ